MFNLYTFLIYVFLSAYTPGPNNIMSMSNGVRFGFKKTFRFNLGIFAGFLLVVPICALFSASLFNYIPTIKIYMLIVGASYMLYLAWKTLTASSEIDLKETKGAGFVSGMLLQFINPKIYIYSITSMSTFILPSFDSVWVVLLFALLMSFVGFSGTVVWALFGSAFCKILAKHTKAVNITMALLLVYCAVSLFLK